MLPVTQRELSSLLDDAHLTSSDFPGIDLMRAHVIDVLSRALTDRGSVDVRDLDAILQAAHETREHRLRYQLGDPYAESRARCIDICTRLRAELTDLSAQFREILSRAGQSNQRWVVGTRIRAARRQAGLTQADLAEKLEVHQATVARWEAGVLVPTPRHRRRLADLLGGTPADYED